VITVSSETCMVQVVGKVFASVLVHENMLLSGNIKSEIVFDFADTL